MKLGYYQLGPLRLSLSIPTKKAKPREYYSEDEDWSQWSD